VDGLSVHWLVYPKFLVPLKHRVVKGRWLDTEVPGECVIGGDLAKFYSVGDTITTEYGVSFKVAWKLGDPPYVLTTNIRSNYQSIDLYFTKNYKNVFITYANVVDDNDYASLFIRLKDGVSFEEAKKELEKYGALTSFGEMYRLMTGKFTHYIGEYLWTFVKMALISLFIATGSVYIIMHKNIRNFAVLSLYGEKIKTLIRATESIYAFAFILAYIIAAVYCKLTSNELTAYRQMPGNYLLSFLMLAVIFAVNCAIITAVFRRTPMRLYIENR